LYSIVEIRSKLALHIQDSFAHATRSVAPPKNAGAAVDRPSCRFQLSCAGCASLIGSVVSRHRRRFAVAPQTGVSAASMPSGLHEKFERDHRVESASDARFGLVVGGLLAVIGCVRAYFYREFGWFSSSLAVIGMGMMLAALVKPDLLHAANRGWVKLGLLLHRITNPVFLGVIYYGAVVPTGLAMRAFGIDPMGMRRPRKDSYWIARTKSSSTSRSLEKPF
jgi:hypothetical protein